MFHFFLELPVVVCMPCGASEQGGEGEGGSVSIKSKSQTRAANFGPPAWAEEPKVAEGRGRAWLSPAPGDVPREKAEIQPLEPAQDGTRQAGAPRGVRIHQAFLRLLSDGNCCLEWGCRRQWWTLFRLAGGSHSAFWVSMATGKLCAGGGGTLSSKGRGLGF